MKPSLAKKPPPWRALLVGVSFTESFSTVLLERGVYFFTHARLGFSEAQNLWLALSIGITYVTGALLSHRVAARLGERRALGLVLGLLFGLHAVMTVFPHVVVLVMGLAAVAFLQGAKWPVIESYIGSGLGPRLQLSAIGRFNVSWALAVPLALAGSGPIIATGVPWMLFAVAGGLNLLALAALPALPRVVVHLAATHPERLPEPALQRYRRLLVSSRWSMLASYALLFLLAPLMPDIFQRLGQSVERATLWAACLDAVRVATFAALSVITVWHGRGAPLVLVAIGLPASFCAALFGSSLGVVLAGEVVFGVLSGLTYYSALYYAMVVKNASVDAGGVHESLIGLGFALGPAAGLVGHALARAGSSYATGMLAGVIPLLAICSFGSLWPLVRDAKHRQRP